ncbi:Arginine exporter protein ArgO [Cupriavidus yeoncheonensis]|uniref:Arginine exporter protein ArgO n=1 Tax=Cupriavidus yeoncheonensis TaxID=1462994 RepID=A0A916MXZ6_9BURK|nr:LysE/ArgO family amino acid transporter [Cupriavidus yeoncheonensis]CAG2156228.1 Arginine exporter protein ArgO [Cupriavidus yeoncheonensis]
MDASLAGFSLGFSLILAIGSQNAFVLRQGLCREHVFWVCFVCALSDALLILAGVSGFAVMIRQLPWLGAAMRYGGAAFLIWYGARSFLAALHSSAVLDPSNAEPRPLLATLGVCLAFTWLNPHVYLDTVMLIGSVSTQFHGREMQFATGAMTASFLFFFALGYGAALLRQVFARPRAWQVLEVVIGVTMLAIAAKLLLG